MWFLLVLAVVLLSSFPCGMLTAQLIVVTAILGSGFAVSVLASAYSLHLLVFSPSTVSLSESPGTFWSILTDGIERIRFGTTGTDA